MSPLPLYCDLGYLAASILFIIGLKRLSSPATARSGNQLASYGMACAVLATLLVPGLHHMPLILGMIALGVALGVVGARRVPMTDMPQMVALLNGLGGGGAALVSILEFLEAAQAPGLAVVQSNLALRNEAPWVPRSSSAPPPWGWGRRVAPTYPLSHRPPRGGGKGARSPRDLARFLRS